MNLRELSDLLGLSQTTVSRALSGYPEVREETRIRVAKAARDHGYRPNRRAASLATGRAMAIGHVIPASGNRDMVNPVFTDFLAGAGDVYASANYDLLLSVVPDGDELRAYRQLASTGSVDGLIVHSPRTGDPRIGLLRTIGLPFVVHGRLPEAEADYSFVDVNSRRAFRRATDLLLDLGHCNIALINGDESLDFARRRREGHVAALEARGVPHRPDLHASGEMSEGNGFRAARTMLAAAKPPTAFLTASMILAIGVRRALHDEGLRLGRDASIVTHDDMLSYLGNGEEVPIFTATRSSVRAAGRRCAEILLDRIARPGQPPMQEVWESELVLGSSTGPASDRSAS